MISLQTKVSVLTHSDEHCYDRFNKFCNDLNAGKFHSTHWDGGDCHPVTLETIRLRAHLIEHRRLFNLSTLHDMIRKPSHCLGTVLSFVDNSRKLSYPPVMLEKSVCTKRVDQAVAYVPYEDKMDRLMSHLLTLHEGLIIIFVKRNSTCRCVADDLSARGFPVCSIHTSKAHSENDEALQGFQQSRHPILVIPESFTHVVLGLNTPLIHVINYDVPVSVEDYSRHLAGIYSVAGSMPSQSIVKYMETYQQRLASLNRKLDRIIKLAESLKPCAATAIVSWWRRRQLEMHRARIHRSALVIQQWTRSTLPRVRVHSAQMQRAAAVRIVHTTYAATSIQVWRRYIVNRRKKAKLAAAALSCAFRERGQPLPPRSRRTRYRQKQRAEGKRRSKRYRPSRKRGQQRGRPPNSVQQQTSQSSVQRREIVLGKAHHIQCDLSSRGNSIGKALHLYNRVSSCRGNDIGKALTDSITVSSSKGELDKPSTHRHLDPTSSDENKPRRRRRRRKTRNPSGIGKRGGVSASKCHTQGANYSPPASQLPRKSKLRDMFRLQFQQAAADDRSLLINLMFEVLKEAVESLHHPRPSPPVPEALIGAPSSVCSSTSVNGDPSVPSSSSSLVEPSSLTFCSSLSSESDASSSTSVVDSQSSSTSASHLSVANKSGSSPPFLLEVLRSPSSHKSVDTPPPSSTTLLVESLPSSSAITAEITDRRQQLNYLQALLGKAPNIG
mmetsp:Transcript_27134/g.46134  ORF Transcript_27134/g.46134 Transcript_27134/m.46134 type:complete len:724 (-) Transcript_27134:411-2582(-)